MSQNSKAGNLGNTGLLGHLTKTSKVETSAVVWFSPPTRFLKSAKCNPPPEKEQTKVKVNSCTRKSVSVTLKSRSPGVWWSFVARRLTVVLHCQSRSVCEFIWVDLRKCNRSSRSGEEFLLFLAGKSLWVFLKKQAYQAQMLSGVRLHRR